MHEMRNVAQCTCVDLAIRNTTAKQLKLVIMNSDTINDGLL